MRLEERKRTKDGRREEGARQLVQSSLVTVASEEIEYSLLVSPQKTQSDRCLHNLLLLKNNSLQSKSQLLLEGRSKPKGHQALSLVPKALEVDLEKLPLLQKSASCSD